MPRIRTIKPDFFTSDTVSALPLRARLTWIGLWTHCDDHGRCRDNVKLIKAAVWPLDEVSLRDIESDLRDLEAAGVLFRYEVAGKGYLQVTNWREHQKVDHPSKSPIPPPDSTIALVPTLASSSRDSREELASPREDAARARAGKERKGKEGTRERASPPTIPGRCPDHAADPSPPSCGACADARKAHAREEVDRAYRLASAPRCRKHRGQPADNCGLCRSEALAAP
jgi:hypothetical protein